MLCPVPLYILSTDRMKAAMIDSRPPTMVYVCADAMVRPGFVGLDMPQSLYPVSLSLLDYGSPHYGFASMPMLCIAE